MLPRKLASCGKKGFQISFTIAHSLLSNCSKKMKIIWPWSCLNCNYNMEKNPGPGFQNIIFFSLLIQNFKYYIDIILIKKIVYDLVHCVGSVIIVVGRFGESKRASKIGCHLWTASCFFSPKNIFKMLYLEFWFPSYYISLLLFICSQKHISSAIGPLDSVCQNE